VSSRGRLSEPSAFQRAGEHGIHVGTSTAIRKRLDPLGARNPNRLKMPAESVHALRYMDMLVSQVYVKYGDRLQGPLKTAVGAAHARGLWGSACEYH